MADDALFDGEQEPQGEQAEGQAGEGQQPKAQAASGNGQAAGLPEEIVQYLQHQAGNQQQLMQAVAAIWQQLQGQQRGQEPVGGASTNSGGAEGDDARFQKLYEDPEAFVKGIAEQASREQLQKLGPYLKLQAEQTRDEHVASQAAVIDQEYGDGTWQEIFAEPFVATLERMPLEMQASRDHVDAAVSTIFGRIMRDPETFKKLESRRQEVAKKAQEAPPTMMTGVRTVQRSQSNQLSDDEKEFVARLQRSGINYDPKQYLAARNRVVQGAVTAGEWKPKQKEAS